MNKLYNLAKVSTATTGTGTITLGSALSGFLTFANAGVSDGEVVTYGIRDGVNSEVGTGTYTTIGTTLTRTTVYRSTGAGFTGKIDLSGNAQVSIAISNEDLKTPTSLTGFSLRDTSASFDVTIAAVSSPVLNANRTLTLDMSNVAHTLDLGATANTITFPSASSFTVAALSVAGTWSATQTSMTLATASLTGVTTLTNNGSITAAGELGLGATPLARLYLAGTYTTSNDKLASLVGTFASSSTSAQALVNVSSIFAPAGASATSLSGIVVAPTLNSTAITISSISGISSALSLGASYTGSVTNIQDYLASDLVSTIVPGTFTQFRAVQVNNSTGLTSGSIALRNFWAGGIASSAAGGTINSRSIEVIVPNGSASSGTNNNYGVYITGNGGTSAGGTVTNYALLSVSTAPVQIAGELGIGGPPTSRFNISGTYTTENLNLASIAGTFASSNTSSQRGLLVNPIIAPSGASLTQIVGLWSVLNLNSTSFTISNVYGVFSDFVFGASFTGVVTNYYGFFSSPIDGGGGKISTAYQFHAGSLANGDGLTTGTVTNIQYAANGITSGSAGGTVSNRGYQVTVPSGGSTSGTTNNYGIYIAGNGGTAAGGTVNNFSLLSISTAPMQIGGMFQFLGATSAFPSLKRNSTTLEVRLADDSALAPLSSSYLKIGNAGSSVVAIDDGDISGNALETKFQFDASTAFTYIQRSTADVTSASLIVRKSRGDGTTPTVVVTGDDLFLIRAYGYDGTAFSESSRITFDSIGTIATGIVSGRMVFSTTNDAGVLTSNLFINETGLISFAGVTSTFPALKRSSATLQVRLADDSGDAPINAEYFESSVGNALTAAGTDRATALQLANQVNNVTTVASGTGVILPLGVVGRVVDIFNAGANVMKVYATASETIDTVAGVTGVNLTNANRCRYFFTVANTWISAKWGVVSS